MESVETIKEIKFARFVATASVLVLVMMEVVHPVDLVHQINISVKTNVVQ